MEEQKRLFKIIRKKVSDQFRLADVIEELLDVSSDSAYRRIRGEKELSFSELIILSEHFSLSIDEIIKSKSQKGALFQYIAVNLDEQDSYMEYIQRLLSILTGLKSAQDKEILFTAQDIPFYHFLNYTELMFFKLYAWNDTLTQNHVSYRQFCNNLDKESIVSIYNQMSTAYSCIPTKEIWTNQTIDTILRLMDYHIETGAFDRKETALLLLEQLAQLMDCIAKDAERGHKEEDKKTPFSLYLCSVDFENNFFLTRREGKLACTIKLYTVNSIATDNEPLCLETQKWVEDLISKSILISGTSGKERFRFFQTSKNKIESLINKVELSDFF